MTHKTLADVSSLVRSAPRPVFSVPLNGERLLLELYSDQGIVRFRLGQEVGGGITLPALLKGLIGTLLGSASKAKEGLLGSILGMLVGGAVGQASAPVEKVLALQFDPLTGQLRLYDGSLVRWAKRAIQPAAS